MEKCIGLRLKKYREDAHLTVEEVCQKLNALGYKLSPKTLYGYENDVSSPKISVFVSLCNLYGVTDISGSFGYSPAESQPDLCLSARERALILAYRQADETTKHNIEKILEIPHISQQPKDA